MILTYLPIWAEDAEIHGVVITAMDVTSLSAAMRGKAGEVGMTREDVISWIEYLSDDARSKADGLVPTNIEIACGMAIDALKAQEPHLITVKDFENNPNVDHDGFLPAWIEYRRDGDWGEYWEGQPDEWGVCKEDRIVYESMRYWTSRPTDAQREATSWNAQK